MHRTARLAATISLAAAALALPLAQASAAPQAGPAGLYAPSELVLTLAHGTSAADAAPARAVTLSCGPTARGSHPDPAAACAELAAAQGDFDALAGSGQAVCDRRYAPVVITVSGVWQGKRTAYERTFSNECVKNSQGRTVFAF
ncbi:SSI family serine proteinase inhibitor [Streptomyces physcomitrii]|uniref:Probable subtilase-type protease inhibitor n=1 Tax=Streptomyces physcomitrii TaxID=2724184 RepID=A0ABX1H5P6_9ACTN|nr:SSI family serine proteinase inhibitor [Streptomyces physcomitrii]NKI43686.1 protease inhibitor protein [Streptomyces physcomitrii]